jgi:phosphoribosylanthranilate isomerase
LVRVKICCISSLYEAELAVRYGAAALGLVGHMPSGPGVIGDDLIAEIAAAAPPAVATFLLTSETEPDAIVDHVLKCGTGTVQLVDAVNPAAYPTLRKALPHVKIVQVIHVAGPESVEEAREYAALADALLLDSGRPAAAVKELGGTGRVHDWSLSRRIVAEIPRPVFLAGGLRPDNAAEAAREVRPFGLDLCTGVRSDGQLDEAKLKAFFGALQPVA